MIQNQKEQSESYHDALMENINQFAAARSTEDALLSYLELSEDSEFFDAFTLPEEEDGMTRVGKHGKKIDDLYLINLWCTGLQAGIFEESAVRDYPRIWEMDYESRQASRARWIQEMMTEHVSDIVNLVEKFNECQERLGRLFAQRNAYIIKSKRIRIIGCTTTGAAMYQHDIQQTSPGVILVEEAGEILEPHTLTAMTSETKQLILIGDHKQLRPKVNNYELTIEKGEGYNLNMSMFERLVLAGVPHTTLNLQHRMRPEISSLVRNLNYPELEDAAKTLGRPHLRGLQDNVIFVSHNEAELNAKQLADRRDEGATSSKENQYEVDMVLKFVRYLAQQGYSTDDLVILTPYLGQLFLLAKTLSRDNDPVLSDLDSYELIRAGLLSPAAANIAKSKIRISTIGEWQYLLFVVFNLVTYSDPSLNY
jgi:hypothetical protein